MYVSARMKPQHSETSSVVGATINETILRSPSVVSFVSLFFQIPKMPVKNAEQ